MGFASRYVLTVQPHPTRSDRDQAEQRFDERRLAGTVGADDPDQLALLEGERGSVEDVDPGKVAGDQIPGLEHDGPLPRRLTGVGQVISVGHRTLPRVEPPWSMPR